MQKIYINGSGCISPQNTFEGAFPFQPIEKEGQCVRIEKPNYKKYISPIRLRRMKHILRMGIASANKALEETGSKEMDAIICGTAMGCMEDTEKFLISIIDNKEDLLNPTAFIQSTHNTIAGQIALINKCNGYNYTYVNRGFSFENALVDARLMIHEGKAKKVLTGGVDESTDNYLMTYGRIGLWKQEENIKNLELLNYNSPGSIYGEGSAFFVLEDEKKENSKAELTAIQLIYKAESGEEVADNAHQLLKKAGLSNGDVDLFLSGMNGDNREDYFYTDFANKMGFDNIAYFKHLCGEYHTSGAFATWLASEILNSKNAPEYIMAKGSAPKVVKNILIYNHYRANNHSLILLSAVS